MLKRSATRRVLHDLRKYPAVIILGPRQVGKTTLAEEVMGGSKQHVVRLDLEDPDDLLKMKRPKQVLDELSHGLVVIDEVQRMPELFPLLRVLIDRNRRPGRFLLLGSASPDVARHSGESLAGRASYLDLHPLSIEEVGLGKVDRLWMRGGFPLAYLARSEKDARDWTNNMIRSFIDRDLPFLGLDIPTMKGMDMLRMLASVHGQVLNMSMLAKSLGLTIPTIKKYIHHFEQAFMVHLLPSYHTNARKRLAKSPKLYIADSGVLHRLLQVQDLQQLRGHVAMGNSWEGFVIQQLRARLTKDHDLYFYRTLDGSELDLVVAHGSKAKAAIEIKSTNAPVLSKGNRQAYEAVNAPLNLVLTPDAADFPYGDGIQVCSLKTVWRHLGI